MARKEKDPTDYLSAGSLAKLFGDKPLYSDILLRQSQDALEKAYRGAESRVKGQIGAQAREGGAALRTTAIRGGYAGSPVEAALQRKLTADVTKTGADTMEQLESKKAAQETNLGLEMGKARIQEQQARDKARSDMLKGLVGGAASLAGYLIPGAGLAKGVLDLGLGAPELTEGLSLDDITNFILA